MCTAKVLLEYKFGVSPQNPHDGYFVYRQIEETVLEKPISQLYMTCYLGNFNYYMRSLFS